ncbi:D-aminoacid aminotransferase-like PLP-dependent enzyme [Aspergillus sergii]|uniref:D-aminoacid aminotransferase-like PLP-dependent enzyme n=1 Tax=Aspergillus sergii TaxID=1034303 RepID=A0A5N6XD63_9EURO|nr:D-aminoacid aminotransferase-like PLP-dependent enzyme [Aspergillus sergii]
MTSMQKGFAGYTVRQAAPEASRSPLAKGITWIEGEYVPLAEARIPLFDQGFMHSDLTYVPSIWDGRFFRLEVSCAKLRLKFPLPREEVKQILVDMVARGGIRDAFVELIVTRGLKDVRGTRPEDIVNRLYPEVQHTGGSATVARTVRRVPPGAIDPTIKNLQWGDLVPGMFETSDPGATYPFLTDGDAHLMGGSGFSIVLVKDGVLYTPDRVRLEFVPVELAYNADEVFMSTTAGGIMPITSLDGKPVNGGQVGPVTKAIWDTYWAMHYDPAYSFRIDYYGAQRSGVNGFGKL